MGRYILVLDSGEKFYYDNIEDARIDRLEFGGTIYNENGRIVY